MKKTKHVTIESGHDPRLFSDTYATPLRIHIGDDLVYDSESGPEQNMRKIAEKYALEPRSGSLEDKIDSYVRAMQEYEICYAASLEILALLQLLFRPRKCDQQQESWLEKEGKRLEAAKQK